MINGHGDDRNCYQNPIRADFSSNVWFGGTDSELIGHLQENMQMIGHYPEPDAAVLCRKIAEKHQVKKEQVLAFNGSVEGFYTIALAFRASVSAILFPAFAEYEDACRMHSHQLDFFRGNDLLKTLENNPGLIWFGNPNNPDGSVFSFQKISRAIEAHPETIFVIDEAYGDFYPEFESAVSLTKTVQNLVVVRSLTKCCAIPGLRLGYVIASEILATRLRNFQQPWSVNALAQEAGVFLLNTKTSLDVKLISQLSIDLQHEINQLGTFSVVPSKAPFFLIEITHGTAATLKQFLLDEFGILIRDASNFRGLNDRYFRICVRDEKDNCLLLDALKCYVEKINKEKTEVAQLTHH